MERIRTTDLAAHAGERVTVQGWLHQTRTLGGIRFLLVRDGYGVAQVVTEEAARWRRWRGACRNR